MTSLPAASALLLALCLPAPARAQVLVVPPGAAVVVPPRSAVAPLVRSAVPVRRRTVPDDAVALGTVSDRSGVSPALLLLPLVAAAVLAATLSGGNEAGGHSGPVRTR